MLIVGSLTIGAGLAVKADDSSRPERTDADKLWAFQPAKPRSAPQVKNANAVRNPIDAFVEAQREQAGLSPAPEADRRTLIRRVSFDLIGLPPTPREIDAFVNDRAPDAYEKLVDRLLASAHYGERWALFWLDLVRFAESDGFKADAHRPTAWRYRDYVIRSLNSDKPYARFVQEQLAGDQLFPGDKDAQLATGYLRHYPDEYNTVNLELRRQEILNDITDTTSQVFLGLTLGCARCHDHKFDPIGQDEYYQLQAFFAAFKPVDVPVADVESERRYEQQMREWDARTDSIRKRLHELEEPQRQKFVASRKFRFPKEYQAMYEMPAEKRSPFQQQMATMLAKQLEPTGDELAKGMKPAAKKEWQELNKQLASFTAMKPRPIPTGLAMTDLGCEAPPTYLLKRGDLRTRGKEVTPGFIAAVAASVPRFPTTPTATTTRRRSQLALWLTRPEHPLTARVMVNRLWQHHFGRGIVATPSDFGAQGDVPTHPELLDWLAGEFSARGWRLKTMHRLMVTSATYRQSTDWNAANARIDPDNHMLWRMNRRRLEGEALRDSMLAISGRLNARLEGSSVYPDVPSELGVSRAAWPVTENPVERNRRSIYVFVKRNLRYPFFSIFDAPDGNETCARRNLSTTAPQALLLLNNQGMLEHARAFAERVLQDSGGDLAEAVSHAYQLALGRSPNAEESAANIRFLNAETQLLNARRDAKAPLPQPVGSRIDSAAAGALVDFCHVLLNLNEFLYID